MCREQRASLQVNRDIDLNRGQIDTYLVGNVLQIVAEAAADRETEELSSIKPEAHAAGLNGTVSRHSFMAC